LRRTLDFSKTYSLHSTSGTYTELFLYLNNAYAVDGSSSAIGYAKYMGFYNKCYVIGARVVVKGAVQLDGTGEPPGNFCGLAVTTDVTSFASQAALIEGGFCRWTVTGASPCTYTITESVDVGRFLHKVKLLDDPSLYSTASASPAQVIVAHVGSATLSTSYSSYNLLVAEVELECVFTDPIIFS